MKLADFKNLALGHLQVGMLKFAGKIVNQASLIGQRPEAMGAFMDAVDGRLQRNQGGDRMVISTKTLHQMAHMEPITFAIINKFKTRITKMRWNIGPDLTRIVEEIKDWERAMAAYLSPYAPSGYKPVLDNYLIPEEVATDLRSQLLKLNVKTPQARLKARWLFDQAETEMKLSKGKTARQIEEFMMHMNTDSSQPFKDWLELTIDDMCTYDAGATVKRRYKDGTPLEAYAINGSQVVRYRNPDYSTPQPPYRAYAWEENGKHIADFTTDDMTYMMANPQHGGYGFSPLEAIVHVVMASLYAETYNLDAFRSQIPPAIMNLGPVTDAQRIRFRTEWANEVMGRGGVHRLMFMNIKGGEKGQLEMIPMKQLTQEEMQFMEYLKWNLVVKCMCFQISPQDIGFTADLHRTTAEVQQQISTEGILDMANLLEGYINAGIIENMFGQKDLCFKFERDQEVFDKDKAQMYDTFVKDGVLSINRVREKLGERPLPEGGDDPFIMTRTEIVPVSAIFGRDSSLTLDVQPDPKGGEQPGDQTPTESSEITDQPGSIDTKPSNAQKGIYSRGKVLEHRKNRSNIHTRFADKITEGTTHEKTRALQAIRNALGTKPNGN